MAKQFRRLSKPSIPKAKHPLSVHVWAGISTNGTTDIAIFTGVMDSSGYQTIMEKHLLPLLAELIPTAIGWSWIMIRNKEARAPVSG